MQNRNAILFFIGMMLVFDIAYSLLSTCQPTSAGAAEYRGIGDNCTVLGGAIPKITGVVLHPIYGFLETHEHPLVAGFTVILAFSTVFLWLATVRLAKEARAGAEIQAADTRILQRAYVGVKPLGIARFSSGDARYSCDVLFENAGNLPARNVRWFIDRVFSSERFLNAFPINEEKFEGNGNVITPRNGIRKGGMSIDGDSFEAGRLRPGESWLYVWGEIRYNDGFGVDRFTKFCHRYNMAGVNPVLRVGNFDVIPERNGRYHVYGNAAD